MKRKHELQASSSARKTMSASVSEGSAWGVMNGFGESFVAPFAIALGASNAVIGVMTALPQLLGSGVQELGASLVERTRSRAPLLVWSTSAKAVIWLLILAIPFLIPDISLWPLALVGLVGVYVFFHALGIPAWESLMGDTVPAGERGRYFGRREKVIGVVALASSVVAGWLLSLFQQPFVLYGFAVIFFIAFLAGELSAFLFTKHVETRYERPRGRDRVGFLDFVKNLRHGALGSFVPYAAVYAFAANLAAPFFVVYMLEDLGFSYTTFALVHAASVLATIVSMPYWGQLIDRYGPKRVLQAAGFLTTLVPLVWLLSPNPLWIATAEVYSGFVWAGFNLATVAFVLAATTPVRRPRYVAHFNLLYGFGVFGGALVGGLLATSLQGATFSVLHGLAILLFISGIVRLAVYGGLSQKLKTPEHPIERISERTFITRLVTTYPVKGLQNELYNTMYSLRHFGKDIRKTLRKH